MGMVWVLLLCLSSKNVVRLNYCTPHLVILFLLLLVAPATISSMSSALTAGNRSRLEFGAGFEAVSSGPSGMFSSASMVASGI